MNQPARRKSSLSGANPVAPLPEPPVVATPTEIRPTSLAHPAQPPPARTTTRTDRRLAQQRRYPPKVSFYQDPEDTARLRATYRHPLRPAGRARRVGVTVGGHRDAVPVR